MGNETAQEWANQIVKDCAAYSNKQMRDFVVLLRQQARNLEYKDFHDASDKMWKERNSATIRALEAELRRREASDLELSGMIDVDGLCGAWRDWLTVGYLEPLSWMLHGALVLGPKLGKLPVSDLLFLRALVLEIGGSHD